MLGVNILTALLCALCCISFRRKLEIHAASSLSSCKASEKASIEASTSALLLADIVREYPEGENVAPVRPVVVGYGQTRSKNAVYIYRDIEQDGVVHREYIERIPFDLARVSK